ncbi:MAG: exodeoxyribonuclease VII large subunit [Peptostreptococcus sp.]|uniref:Exodeoxyribonuclease 7 large subunit n=1 Tax=Peptostreptococcus anaerobius TaxID=1261 RepID=A0A135YVT9_9FIRM|nr:MULTISPECIES: exodeoxyribonuclease VII large subunit [Peptostreptococcus]EKX95608.1 exodeoxyribonuclease VII, large subunit [Peptostreptococcus anaerobius VPI 4330 = DSM 2949]KXI13515.1 exodeoxyribonuclease VII, large subunit [Peptostreptococcus anaerobius]MCB6982020.1 exodeoxyribonuclease VII large subunit [Peptostreptococcus anaerobius]MCQ5149983.1 exodeoxyribonuclease VII large subunit [Peptostreptococcus anaerobius]MDB8849383.1 exodeoxyribonuclease VII large subunit [Peptostreptococcus 
MKLRPLEVSELNSYIKKLIADEPILGNVMVKGEVSNFKIHSSGNVYLSLKDKDSKVNCIILRRNFAQDMVIKDGTKIIASGSVRVYERDGAYQLYINSVEVEGMGNLYYQYLQMKERLEKEGLFSPMHKKKIPRFPKVIGVITSPTGAVIRDIINVVSRRYPRVEIKLFPVLVQGERSEESLIRALDFFNRRDDIDTIIIGRGGGSLEELWSFNSEALARKIFDSKIPIISAVGHETDYTICDFVADLRAPTPSSAAELATPDLKDLLASQDILVKRMSRAVSNKIEIERQKVSRSIEKTHTIVQKDMIDMSYVRLDRIQERMAASVDRRMVDYKNKLSLIGVSMGNLNPFSVMDRGYSVVESSGGLVQKTTDVELGEDIDILLSDGSLRCQVKEKICR